MSYSVGQSGNTTIVRIQFKNAFEQSFLISSDRHWDNPKSNQELQRKHLEQAKKKRAGVIDLGDFFCAMQGKGDPRHDKSSVRPEHQVDDYLDSLIRTATVFFAPYAKSFIRIAIGNHESAVHKRHETCLISRLTESLNLRTGSKIQTGGYSGWVMFVFEGAGITEHKKLWYIHGHGGGGHSSKGTLQSAQHAAYVPDADICAMGHIHEEWSLTVPRTRLNDKGEQYLDEQVHICVPSYKEEYRDGSAGWHIERGGGPKPVGAVWLTFKKSKDDSNIETIISRAK